MSCMVNRWLAFWVGPNCLASSKSMRKKYNTVSFNIYGFFATFVWNFFFISVSVEVGGFEKFTLMPPSFSLKLVLILLFAF